MPSVSEFDEVKGRYTDTMIEKRRRRRCEDLFERSEIKKHHARIRVWYLRVRATSRSGYIPLLERRGRGRGRVPSLGKEGLGWL